VDSFVVRRLDAVAAVGEKPRTGIRDWLPLRVEMGISAFGVNAFVARQSGDVLVERHTEAGVSEHEELYVVLSGNARFVIDDETLELSPGDLLFVRDPRLRRSATAVEPGTTVLVVGGRPGHAYVPTGWELQTLRAYGRRTTGR
jgi:oxalate decarboxylase/phosphoglucose isomerase-like protein (cupin superfamily)